MKLALVLLVAFVACVFAQQATLPQPQGGLYDQNPAASGTDGKNIQKRGIFGYGYGYPYGGFGGYPFYGGFYGGWPYAYGGFYG